MQCETESNSDPHVSLPIVVIFEKSSNYWAAFHHKNQQSILKITPKVLRLVKGHEDHYCSPFRAAYDTALYNKNLAKIKLMCFRLALLALCTPTWGQSIMNIQKVFLIFEGLRGGFW